MYVYTYSILIINNNKNNTNNKNNNNSYTYEQTQLINNDYLRKLLNIFLKYNLNILRTNKNFGNFANILILIVFQFLKSTT